MGYVEFLSRKHRVEMHGFEPLRIPDKAFPFQSLLIEWSIRMGRSAIFADCGMGKTLMQLAFAENVVLKTNKPVLLLTPLAVGNQTVMESEKFGIESVRSRSGMTDVTKATIYVTNYEQLVKYDPDLFGGIVCDESSCLKNDKSQTKGLVKEFSRKIPYRLCCTATAAPNDWNELGTTSDSLGYLGYRDMLTYFFTDKIEKDHLGWGRVKYRLKGHSQEPFWRWVCSWARAIRKPSDYGFSDDRFELPELRELNHIVETAQARDGMLFSFAARNLQEQREERRNSIGERVGMASELATEKSNAIWCELNSEADELERSIAGAKQVSGSMSTEHKEELFEAFGNGQIRTLVCKPKIGAWGLNWQHCNNVICFPSHSFEQYYQLVRRCWRFGQKNPVAVHRIVNEGELPVLESLERKSRQADAMFSQLVKHMSDSLGIDRNDSFTSETRVPQWL